MDTVLPRIRRAAVAGYCYPEEPIALTEALRGHLIPGCRRESVRAAILPHGSLEQMGSVAGAALSRIEIPARCIIVGPQYAQSSGAWSVLSRGCYETPFGQVPVDEDLADGLRRLYPQLTSDPASHSGEHAIETVLPFLQLLGPRDLSIVPILTGNGAPSQAFALAEALAATVESSNEPVLLIATSFLSQYEEAGRGAAKDLQILERITSLEPIALLKLLREENTVMSGSDAVACVLEAVRRMAGGQAEVVRYAQWLAGGTDTGSAVGCGGIILR